MAAKKKSEPSFLELQKQLNTELKEGQFRQCYLLCGSQAYLRGQNRDKLEKYLLGDGDRMNVSAYKGADLKIEQIIDQADTLPFFADRRVIILENTGFLGKSKPDISAMSDRLAAYLSKAPDTTFWIFNEESVDKRKKLYKAIKDRGLILPCENLDDRTLRSWTAGLFKTRGVQINARNLDYFLSRTGTDMFNILTEAEKLAAYTSQQGVVEARDIEAVCSIHLEDRIFDMIDAVTAGNVDTALAMYMELIGLQTAPQPILALIERQLRILLQVRELSAGRMDYSEIAKRTGQNAYFVKSKYLPAALRFREKALEDGLRSCVQADQDYKSGLISDRLAVEMVLVKLSGPWKMTIWQSFCWTGTTKRGGPCPGGQILPLIMYGSPRSCCSRPGWRLSEAIMNGSCGPCPMSQAWQRRRRTST